MWLAIFQCLLVVAAYVAVRLMLEKKNRRIQHLEFELEDRDNEIELRDRAAFGDIATMFRLTEERDNALHNLEMVLVNDSKQVQDMTTALELVLRG